MQLLPATWRFRSPGGGSDAFGGKNIVGYCNDIGYQDHGHIDALVRMFERALKGIGQLPARDRNALIARLDSVHVISHNFGYGVCDDNGFPACQASESLRYRLVSEHSHAT